MNFQVFHVNPGKKLKKKDVNNDLSHFMPVFPNVYVSTMYIFQHLNTSHHFLGIWKPMYYLIINC